MIKAVSLTGRLTTEYAAAAGFEWIEMCYEDIRKLQSGYVHPFRMISVRIKTQDLQEISQVIACCRKQKASYITIETEKTSVSPELIRVWLQEGLSGTDLSGITICVENSYQILAGKAVRNEFSEIRQLKELLVRLRADLPQVSFGIALNTGHAGILAQNIAEMVRQADTDCRLLYANDNDGRKDYHQLPYTFTAGRGTLTTDWYGIIRALHGIGYKGPVIADVEGLVEAAPSELYIPLFRLLMSVLSEWEFQLSLEERLAREGQKRILFGCGIRFENYMKVWGKKYPPAFIADNNAALWNTEKEGIRICNPEEILRIPEEQRFVLICNMYYREIGQQLQKMGIAYETYDDAWWGRFQG
jgi:hypothetical protein